MQEFIPEKVDEAIEDMDVFQDFVVLHQRFKPGVPGMSVLPMGQVVMTCTMRDFMIKRHERL